MEFDPISGTIQDAQGHPVAFVSYAAHHDNPERTYAMAAGPDLLAALRNLANEIASMGLWERVHSLDAANAAIAKAEPAP